MTGYITRLTIRLLFLSWSKPYKMQWITHSTPGASNRVDNAVHFITDGRVISLERTTSAYKPTTQVVISTVTTAISLA